jgi:N-acetylglutamate synthase-like GNAT family acetyltransferase
MRRRGLKMFFLRKAKEADRNWLNTCNLGACGEKIDRIDDYFILLSAVEQRPIGMLAVEMHEKVGYLHSMRFTNGAPTIEQLGSLLDHLLNYCRKQGKKQLCMVVPPASKWLLNLGFIRQDEVPASMEKSTHYQRVSSKGTLLSYPL